MSCRPPLLICRSILSACMLAGCALGVQASPFVPASDATIVETLRDRPLDRTDLDFRQMRSLLRRDPTLLPVALRVAQRAIEISRRDSDPRYLGYAQAALAPWHGPSPAPDSVRLFDAIILQSNHQFDAALAILDDILKHDPRNAQAWLTRTSVLQVQARFAEARQSAETLRALGAAPYAEASLAELDSLSGAAQAGRARLDRLLALLAPGAAAPPGWAIIVRAEMAERMGDFKQADADYSAAIAGDGNAYAKAAYADFLLDRHRPDEVIRLLEADQRADPLLLRLALAYQEADRPELGPAVETLAARFAAARLRGDSVHLREESRFMLHLEHRPDEALRLAALDWAVQKEPADARVLLEAADALHDRDASQAVRRSLPGLEDQRLVGLYR